LLKKRLRDDERSKPCIGPIVSNFCRGFADDDMMHRLRRDLGLARRPLRLLREATTRPCLAASSLRARITALRLEPHDLVAMVAVVATRELTAAEAEAKRTALIGELDLRLVANRDG
jgi:hypothetical protein